jgi:hypothetical protein
MGNRSRIDYDSLHSTTLNRITKLRGHCEECKRIGNPQFRHFKLLFFVQRLTGTFDKNMDF